MTAAFVLVILTLWHPPASFSKQLRSAKLKAIAAHVVTVTPQEALWIISDAPNKRHGKHVLLRYHYQRRNQTLERPICQSPGPKI